MTDANLHDFIGRIGVARRDITPPIGIYARNWGAASHDVAQGVHRPLTATVLALTDEQGGPPLLLAAVDLGWWKHPPDEALVRWPLLDALQLDEARLMICLSHTHAGPSTCREDADQPGGKLIDPYLHHVAEQLIDAARDAVHQAQPARLQWRYGQCDLATNRDLPDPERQRWVVGYHPDGPADATVLVARATRQADGATLATIVNYACHPTTLAWENQLISPDYIGAMREVMEAATGDAPCLFLQGASGELAPAEQYTGDVTVADRHGRRLGHAALAALEAMPEPGRTLAYQGPVESGAALALWRYEDAPCATTLAATRHDIPLPLKPLPDEAQLTQTLDACDDRVQAERLRRKLRLVRMVREMGGETTLAMPLWTWRIGDALLLGQPNEAYSGFQQALRERLRPHPVAVMNLVNGSGGYLVPVEQCDDSLYTCWSSIFDAGAFEVLRDAAIDHAAALVKGSNQTRSAALRG